NAANDVAVFSAAGAQIAILSQHRHCCGCGSGGEGKGHSLVLRLPAGTASGLCLPAAFQVREYRPSIPCPADDAVHSRSAGHTTGFTIILPTPLQSCDANG
ncbi:unnamed protein product, partial [Symbiodinium pilosum]